MERPFSVLLTDLDGVVFWRIPAQKAGIPFIGNYHPQIYMDLLARMKHDHVIKNSKLTPFDLWNAARHIVVPVFPDVVKVLKDLDRNIWVYGNTDRYNNTPMVFATGKSLEMAGILDRFTAFHFREKGVSTLTSKMAGLIRIIEGIATPNEIVMVDDNPLDLIPFARSYPDVRFILIRDLTTDRLLSGVDMKALPNITMAPTLRKGLQGITDLS